MLVDALDADIVFVSAASLSRNCDSNGGNTKFFFFGGCWKDEMDAE